MDFDVDTLRAADTGLKPPKSQIRWQNGLPIPQRVPLLPSPFPYRRLSVSIDSPLSLGFVRKSFHSPPCTVPCIEPFPHVPFHRFINDNISAPYGYRSCMLVELDSSQAQRSIWACRGW